MSRRPTFTVQAAATAAIVLALMSHVSATAIFDYTSAYGVTLSSPWAAIETVFDPIVRPGIGYGFTHQEMFGAGAYDAVAWPVESLAGPDHQSWAQSVRISGSAGDAAFDHSGASSAQSYLYTLLTFDFGALPTDLVVTLTERAHVLDRSTDFPLPWNGTGETAGGSIGSQIVFDYGVIPQPQVPGAQLTFSNLTGRHTIRIGTFAEATAQAIYPYAVPEPGSWLLLAAGLLALLPFRQRTRHG